MKLIFTLIVLFSIATKIPAQKISYEAQVALGIDMLAAPQKDVRIKTGCTTWAENKYVRPLLMIDGVLDESAELQKLNAGDIVSIDILKIKEEEFAAIFGRRPLSKVLIITTKALKKFIVKDIFTGEKIPGATVRFTSIKDTINAIADENGSLVTNKLKTETKYDITVSSAGYKTFSTSVNSNQQEIFLERDIKECANVIVSHTCCPRKMISCGYSITKLITRRVEVENKVITKSVYPNPVQRNTIFNLEFENTQDEPMQLAIISMNGSMVSLQPKKITKGLNHLSITADAKWAAGIYNIQLRNEKGTLIRQEKLVVQ